MKTLVAIIFGSKTDLEHMRKASEVLTSLEISHTMHVLSAHRAPNETAEFAKSAQDKSYEVIIAGAGAAAALPGVLAAHTHLPVIGVPLSTTSLNGLDALFAICQMPASVPVATMSIGAAGAKNAGLLAARILALKYPQISERLKLYMTKVHKDALEFTSIGLAS